MAGQAAKKGALRRAEAEKSYMYPMAITTGLFVLIRLVWGWSDVSNLLLFCFLCSLGTLYMSYFAILNHVQEGTDHEFWLDAYRITCAVQVLGLYSDKAWFLMLAVPGIGLYLMRGIISAFCCSRGNAEPEDPTAGMSRRERRQAERNQTSRPKVKYSRR